MRHSIELFIANNEDWLFTFELPRVKELVEEALALEAEARELEKENITLREEIPNLGLPLSAKEARLEASWIKLGEAYKNLNAEVESRVSMRTATLAASLEKASAQVWYYRRKLSAALLDRPLKSVR